MSSPLNLYVSSNGTDHGPLTLEPQRVASGEFKPDDLSWHQGVSGWVPLKNLPEWNQLNKKSAPPPLLEKKFLPLCLLQKFQIQESKLVVLLTKRILKTDRFR